MEVREFWFVSFDPIQVVLVAAGLAFLIASIVLGAPRVSTAALRRSRLLGVGLLLAAVAYSLVVTWTMPLP